jgi:hypothetical protein
VFAAAFMFALDFRLGRKYLGLVVVVFGCAGPFFDETNGLGVICVRAITSHEVLVFKVVNFSVS